VVALPDKFSEGAAYSFLDRVLNRFGAPAEVLTDQGREFLGEFQTLCEQAMIDHRTTSRDHPEANGLAERMVQTVKRTAKFCGRVYVPPSYHDLYRKFLVQAKEGLQAHLQVKTIKSVRKFGTTLAVDGWNSVTNRPLFNTMLVSPATEQFLGAVNTTGYPKTAEY
jgi:transposase InsO family protein